MKSNLKLLTCPSFAKCQQVKARLSFDIEIQTTAHEEVFEDATPATLLPFCACWHHVRFEIVLTKYGDIEVRVTSIS